MLQHGENCVISFCNRDLLALHGNAFKQQAQITTLCPVLPSLSYLHQCIPDFVDMRGVGQLGRQLLHCGALIESWIRPISSAGSIPPVGLPHRPVTLPPARKHRKYRFRRASTSANSLRRSASGNSLSERALRTPASIAWTCFTSTLPQQRIPSQRYPKKFHSPQSLTKR